jgi:hypothetical protein
MIQPVDVSRKDWRQKLDEAHYELKILVWAESDEKIVEAYTCDTVVEAKEMYDKLKELVGEPYMTVQHRV